MFQKRTHPWRRVFLADLALTLNPWQSCLGRYFHFISILYDFMQQPLPKRTTNNTNTQNVTKNIPLNLTVSFKNEFAVSTPVKSDHNSSNRSDMDTESPTRFKGSGPLSMRISNQLNNSHNYTQNNYQTFIGPPHKIVQPWQIWIKYYNE